MKPVRIGINRSPSRNGVSATETEEKIRMLEVASDNSFFFIVSTLGAGIVSLGAPHWDRSLPSHTASNMPSKARKTHP